MAAVEACTQPECALRAEGVGPRALAELIVRVISGEDVSDFLADRPAIQRRDRCVECTLRLLRGGRALPTVDELEDLVRTGRWSHRRRRREKQRQRDAAG